MKLENLKNKKVLILGFGLEGKSTLKFLQNLFPQQNFAVADQKLDKNYLNNLNQYEIIIKTPGIPPYLPQIKKAKKEGVIFTSQTQLFLENCPRKIIGVTGTKGKSTTASLIYEVLKAGGLPAKLIGNIGEPCLPYLKDSQKSDIFVFELSSHQLADLQKSPQIAVLLNIFREHLDYYPSFTDYVAAKENITRYQTEKDYLIYNADCEILRQIAARTKAKKITFGVDFNLQIKDIPLLGQFNRLNIMPAVIIGQLFKIPLPIVVETIKHFKPLPHRLEIVGTYGGIKFINDSISTIPESAIAAIGALGEEVETLLLGGYERQQNFTELAKKILATPSIKNLILFPTTGARVWKSISKLTTSNSQFPKHFFVNNMHEAIKLVYEHTSPGKICLLSPASPSFGIFKDYQDRGNQFKKYAKLLSYLPVNHSR